MKKIMFNDKYGLTEAVLKLRKEMTRRALRLPDGLTDDDLWNPVMGIDDKGLVYFTFDCSDGKRRDFYPQYQIGEVVAVAQRYKDCWDIYQRRWEAKNDPSDWHTPDAILGDQVDTVKGWKNKMFVRAYFMPHHIRIKNIKVERLQNISDEDCLKEGVYEDAEEHGGLYTTPFYDFYGNQDDGFYEPREAFAALIDRISGKGTWERNPWVLAYEFEKVD